MWQSADVALTWHHSSRNDFLSPPLYMSMFHWTTRHPTSSSIQHFPIDSVPSRCIRPMHKSFIRLHAIFSPVHRATLQKLLPAPCQLWSGPLTHRPLGLFAQDFIQLQVISGPLNELFTWGPNSQKLHHAQTL
jgi:hypothetical protein